MVKTARTRSGIRLATVGALSAALVLSACATQPPESPAEEAPAVEYPTKSITLVIPFDTGGSFDPIGRLYAELLEDELGTSVVVENMPGAAATLGTAFVLDSAPDGYTLGVGSGNALAAQPYLTEGLAYDGVDDAYGIVNFGIPTVVIAVRGDAPWSDFEEFVAAAKASPGTLTVGTSGVRTETDFLLHELMNIIGIEVISAPSTGGGGESIAKLLGGHIDAIVTTAGAVKGQVDAGEMRALAILDGSPAPDDGYFDEDVPTLGDLGYDYSIGLLYFIYGPLGMPDEVTAILEAASLTVVNSDRFKQYCVDSAFICDPVGHDGTMQKLRDAQKSYERVIATLPE